jgi:hypothetical protein
MTVATLSYAPLKGCAFGRVVSGFDPADQTPETMAEIQDALYKVCQPLAMLTAARRPRLPRDQAHARAAGGHDQEL